MKWIRREKSLVELYDGSTLIGSVRKMPSEFVDVPGWYVFHPNGAYASNAFASEKSAQAAAIRWARAGRKPKANPVPPSRKVQLRQAAKLYADFSGHEAEIIGKVPKPEIPDVAVAVGDVDGILYTTVRDGKTERYIHEFAKHARPLLAVSYDGRSIYLLGGAYDFTERGIVDKRR